MATESKVKAAARSYEDELDTYPLPQVMSDLDTRYPGQSTNSGLAQRAPAGTPLSVTRFTPPQKSSGSHSGAIAENLLVVGIPATPKAPVPLTATGRSPFTVSIPPLSAERLRELPKPSSPVVAVGRRTNTVDNNNSRIRGGRPKGWRPGMSYREVALRNLGVDGDATSTVLLTPQKKSKDPAHRMPRQRRIAGSQKPNYVLKRKGRPPLLSIEAVQRSIFLNSKAVFRPFLCEWAGCRAELQNMATLRKHVVVVHGRAAKCCWRKCAERTMPPALPTTGAGGEGETLMEHIEYNHLAPAEWHQGDGFANSGCLGPPALRIGARAEDGGPGHLATVHLPRYLLDEEGNQVTPLLQDPLLEPAALSRSRAETMRRLQDAYRQIRRQRGP
ncbi:hypothetical protein CMQ_1583 [Grosmannia clavigera kw1407]|uniref:C2H2-type domain-containing protein n=1 Tax=Grosmannia clavigera (strain kw1407 / UAMH 11150) TaxID=655863 RepID=F0XDF3_GROCL|nr:uncharacterized protein CMQ_1583 [Grosmannia clavigera kw1407]EFX04655.1 hypothetical protein CMQ_1583 [Grosmannia clavigera kw1407]